MKHLVEYNAPPADDQFREVDARGLADIIGQIQLLGHTATTEASLAGYNLDVDCATRAAELMDSEGAVILVARDEDGYYFAYGAIGEVEN